MVEKPANIALLTLGVGDLPRAVAFYAKAMGWTPANDVPTQGVAFFQLPGLVVALWSRKELARDAGVPFVAAGGFGGVALAHNAPDRASVDALLARAEAAGARIARPARETPWGGYSGYFVDPDGHLVEVAHNPFWPLDGDGRVLRLAP